MITRRRIYFFKQTSNRYKHKKTLKLWKATEKAHGYAPNDFIFDEN